MNLEFGKRKFLSFFIKLATFHFRPSSYVWFFIEYWIKTGLDFYPLPFFYAQEFMKIAKDRKLQLIFLHQ